jgi:LuxR family maltose regulon positive regulatory protein
LNGERIEACQCWSKALALAEPGGFIRIFVDEGLPMMQLLADVAVLGIMPDYLGKLVSALSGAKRVKANRICLILHRLSSH